MDVKELIAQYNIEKINENDTAPLYLRLQNVFRNRIKNKNYGESDAIPTEREIAKIFDVSRVTVRKALDSLVAEGLLIRRQGSGTFIADRVEKSFSKLSSFSEDMQSRGREPKSVWISKTRSAVTPKEALALSLSPNAMVFRFKRIRFADGETMAIETSTIPEFCLPSADFVKTSLYKALEENGYKPVRALQRLRAINFNEEQAEKLKINSGDAGLFIERKGFLPDGRACEFTQSYYRGDMYDMVAELGLGTETK